MTTTTVKYSNIKWHDLHMPALVAGFGCRFPSSNLINTFTSFIRHPFENLQETIERKIGYLSPPESLHCGNVQRFEVHGIEPIAQGMCQLKEPVGSAVSYSLVCFTQSMLRLAAIVATSLFSCQLSTAFGYFSHTCLKELWTFNGGTVAASEECLEAEVKPSRVNGTSGLTNNIFLLARKHHPKPIHSVSLDCASFDLAGDLARFDELVLILTEADYIATAVGPAGLSEYNTSWTCRFPESRLPSFQSSPLLDPRKERLVRQVKFSYDCLNTLRTDKLPGFPTVAKLGDMLHQLKLVAVLFEKPVVGFLKSNTVVPDTRRRSH